jgi:hypothetical protein
MTANRPAPNLPSLKQQTALGDRAENRELGTTEIAAAACSSILFGPDYLNLTTFCHF